MLMPARRDLLADPKLNERLVRFVRARVPADEAADVVQATLTEALAAKMEEEGYAGTEYTDDDYGLDYSLN